LPSTVSTWVSTGAALPLLAAAGTGDAARGAAAAGAGMGGAGAGAARAATGVVGREEGDGVPARAAGAPLRNTPLSLMTVPRDTMLFSSASSSFSVPLNAMRASPRSMLIMRSELRPE